ncbi:hypothetical protein Tco_0747104 [Tanacetum coccineum]
MHEDYEYVKSLEKEVDELESEKADFSNIYDLLLEECVSKDVTCSYLHSLSDLNAYAELQCLYLHKVKECEYLNQGNVMIKRVYYVEGLNHNLFSVGQFCDADLEVAFRKSTCFVRDLQGNDLLTGNRGSDLYTISLQETTSSTPICLMAKASPSQVGLVSSRNKASDNETLTLCPKKKMLFPYSKEDIYSSHNRVRVEFSLQSLYFGKEYYHPTHGHVEDNNNDQSNECINF